MKRADEQATPNPQANASADDGGALDGARELVCELLDATGNLRLLSQRDDWHPDDLVTMRDAISGLATSMDRTARKLLAALDPVQPMKPAPAPPADDGNLLDVLELAGGELDGLRHLLGAFTNIKGDAEIPIAALDPVVGILARLNDQMDAAVAAEFAARKARSA